MSIEKSLESIANSLELIATKFLLVPSVGKGSVKIEDAARRNIKKELLAAGVEFNKRSSTSTLVGLLAEGSSLKKEMIAIDTLRGGPEVAEEVAKVDKKEVVVIPEKKEEAEPVEQEAPKKEVVIVDDNKEASIEEKYKKEHPKDASLMDVRTKVGEFARRSELHKSKAKGFISALGGSKLSDLNQKALKELCKKIDGYKEEAA